MHEQRVPRLVALRYRDYRLLWSGQLISTTGTQMQIVAVNWNVFELLRHQTFALSMFGHALNLNPAALGLGAIGLARVIPIIVFALLGGVLADVHDRKQVMMWSQLAAAALAIVLTGLTLTDHASVGALLIITALGSAAGAFEEPAEQSLVPQLVAESHIPNAISLNTLIWQVGTIAGPAVAGGLIAVTNVGWVYAINAISFAIVICALLLMHHKGPPAGERPNVSLSSVLEGLRFTYNAKLIWSTALLDFWATFFSSARTMLPIIASEVLGVGAAGYGVLSTAQSVGSLLTGVVISLRREIRNQGVVLLISVAIYGLATILFGLSHIFVFSYLMFALSGAGDTVSTVIRGTIRQISTPDYLRGRTTSVNMIFFMGGPQLGEWEAGMLAALFGAPFAIVTGGIATVLLASYIGWRYPLLRNYTLKNRMKASTANETI